MSELKACPFCGKTDGVYSIPRMIEIIDGVNTYPEWAIGCKNCDGHLYRAYYAKDDGIATWNTRPIEDELRAEIARRDDVIKRLKEVGGRMYIAHDEKDIRECEDWCALMKELE